MQCTSLSLLLGARLAPLSPAPVNTTVMPPAVLCCAASKGLSEISEVRVRDQDLMFKVLKVKAKPPPTAGIVVQIPFVRA